MNKILLLSLLFLLVCFGLVATASAGVDVVVVCPTNVTPGTALTVTVKPYNYDCSGSVTFSRAMMVLGGNAGGTLGGAGIWGPYNKTLTTAWTIPAATCDGYGNVISPGVGSRSQKIVDAVPPALGGTVAMVMWNFLSSSGESLHGGECMVNVVPVQ